MYILKGTWIISYIAKTEHPQVGLLGCVASGASDPVAKYSTQMYKGQRCPDPKLVNPVFCLPIPDTSLQECNRIFGVNCNSVNLLMKRSQKAQVSMDYGLGIPYGRKSSGRREEAEPEPRGLQ